MLSTLIYLIYPSWLAWSSLPLPSWLRWVGVGVALLGFALLQWSQVLLGRNWSETPLLFEGQVMITSGPYRWIRHPIYTAFLLILGSPLLITANWLIGGLWIGMVGFDIAARVKVEEAILTRQFGEPYQAYLQRTGRFFPRFVRGKRI